MKHSLKRQFVIISTLILISASVINVEAGGSGPSAPKPSVGVLSEEVVRARLASAGYGEIKSIQQKGQSYVVETARDGHPVHVKVDAVTGQISEENR